MYHALVSGHSCEGTEGGGACVGGKRAGEDVTGYLIEPMEHVWINLFDYWSNNVVVVVC